MTEIDRTCEDFSLSVWSNKSRDSGDVRPNDGTDFVSVSGLTSSGNSDKKNNLLLPVLI